MSAKSAESVSDASSELDPALAKTPMYSPDNEDESSDGQSFSTSSSSEHVDAEGNKTYFHVWSNMLSCPAMEELDLNPPELPELPDEDLSQVRPLAVDNGREEPLVEFQSLPSARSARTARSGRSAVPSTSGRRGDQAEPCQADEAKPEKPAEHEHAGDEACCDFSKVRAVHNSRWRDAKRRQKLERKLPRQPSCG